MTRFKPTFSKANASTTLSRKESHVTRIMKALLLRDARIRQMIDRELQRETPSALRLMRMKRLALALRQRLDRFVMTTRASMSPTPRLVPFSPASIKGETSWDPHSPAPFASPPCAKSNAKA